VLSAHLRLDPEFAVGEVDRRLFGSFVEHMGRCVYGGIYEPDHPDADDEGFRRDVIELTRELGVSVIRYPGGNFLSAYEWEDGIGPRSERPVRLDRAWRSVETNQVGTDDFMSWARKADVEPMMAVNLGTRGLQEACDLLEYCNYPGGTKWSDLRVRNGSAEPYGVRLWCLGNEMDGPWQMGHKTAHEYGRVAAETARAMRRIDGRIELVASGSSSSAMPTFGTWENTMLTETYDLVDFVSAHAYYQEVDGDTASFLASGVDMDLIIDTVIGTADSVGARLRSKKRLRLSFDEWNVWYQGRFGGEMSLAYELQPRLIEDEYHGLDAVVVGALLISLLRHADRVGVANQAQLVNVIGAIRAEPGTQAWRQTIFHPFALTARHAVGTSLRPTIVSPVQETAKYGDVTVLDAAATTDPESGAVAVFCVNRSADEAMAVDLSVAGRGVRVVEHVVMSGDRVANTQESPDAATPRNVAVPQAQDGTTTVELPAASWSMIRLEPVD
jgi:alpha-L-arabinofuranosidase